MAHIDREAAVEEDIGGDRARGAAARERQQLRAQAVARRSTARCVPGGGLDDQYGALLAARTHGLSDWLVSAGVGAGAEACRLTLENVHDFEVDGMPAERATFAVRVARGLAAGEPIAPDGVYRNGTVDVPLYRQEPRVLSRDNARQIQNLWPSLSPQ